MRLPGRNRNYQTHVDYGRYVAARLSQNKQEELMAVVQGASSAVKTQGRAWEDATEAVTERTAKRDGVDDDLDGCAKDFRLKLASRHVGADREGPYTAIFPKGIGYYTAAPVGQNEARYRELLTRAQAELPSNHPELEKLQSAVPELVDDYREAVAALDKARTEAAMARTALEAEIDDWMVQMEKTYGELVTEKGRRAAERFFPRRSSTADVQVEPPEQEASASPPVSDTAHE